MKASRKLDKLVAKAMGQVEGIDFGYLGQHDWRWNESSEYNSYYCAKCGLNSEDWADESQLPKERCHKYPPDYSTSKFWIMNGLWEWLEQNHPWNKMRLLLGRSCKDCSPFVFVTGKNGLTDEDFYVFGHTYEEAICLAILETKVTG